MRRIAIFLVAALAFGISSNLAHFSSNLVSMSIGDQALPRLGLVTFWTSFVFQPWVLLGSWLEAASGRHHLHMGWVSSTLTGIGSAVLLVCAFWFFVRNRMRLQLSVVALWSFLAVLNIIDLSHTTSIIAESNAFSPTGP
ncbi:MAG: hypothetical protein EOP09_14640 [Proteobacteria bacterium]|nr:MAG: hypothetical protein EOP09_14640 [Pseudomonadota bacterium]